MSMHLHDLPNVFRLILLILSGGLIIALLEFLHNNKLYRRGQLLDWLFIKKTKKIFTKNKVAERIFDFQLDYPNVITLAAVELMLVVSLIVFLILGLDFIFLLFVITLLNLLIGVRNNFSNNGSDQLTQIILISICITHLPGASQLSHYAAICFIAFQAELSYLTSGIFKLVSRGWRDGSALRNILSTRIFGNAGLRSMMEKFPRSYILGGYLIIFGEILLGLTFLFPPAVCLFILITGVCFHFSIAYIMGLNTFLWTFASTYPAIYFISTELSSWINSF